MAAKRPLPSFLIFRDEQGNWRWNLAGPSGRIVATSGQAYSRSAGCLRAIQLMKNSARITVVTRPRDQEAARASAAPAGAAVAAAGDASAAVAEAPNKGASAKKPTGAKSGGVSKPAAKKSK